MQPDPDDIVAAMKVRMRPLKLRLAELLELAAARGAILSLAGRYGAGAEAPRDRERLAVCAVAAAVSTVLTS